MSGILLDKLLFYPFALVCAYIAFKFDLGYISMGVLLALIIIIFENMKGSELLSLKFGVVLLLSGLLTFASSYYLSHQYTLTFEQMTMARELPKLVRNLPFLSSTLLASGIMIVLYQIVASLQNRLNN